MSPHPPLRREDREHGAALYLRARESGDAADARELERWIGGDEARRRLVQGLGRVWEGVGQVRHAPALAGWRAGPAEPARHPAWSRFGPQTRLAASVALIAALGAALFLYVAPYHAGEQKVATPVGERRQLTLPDGSEVVLDAASQMTVRYSAGERVVRLANGQARFRVAHDGRRPFHVEVSGNDVRALGTDFNVATSASATSVSLISGSVLVSQIQRRPALFGLSSVAVKDPVVTLKPGQQFERSGERRQVRPFDPQIVSAWQNGRLVFENLPLDDAVALANRYSRRPIVLDPEYASIKVTGVFNAGDGLPFAQAMTAYLPGAQLEASSSQVLIRKADTVSSAQE